MNSWRDFPGPNAGYVSELYDRLLQDPALVDSATREFFARWTPPKDGRVFETQSSMVAKIVGTVSLTHAILAYGQLAARLDPLGSTPCGDSSLDLTTYGVAEEDLHQLPGSPIDSSVAQDSADALETMQTFRAIYSSNTGCVVS